MKHRTSKLRLQFEPLTGEAFFNHRLTHKIGILLNLEL